MERCWRDPSFNFVQEAFDDYLRQHYTISPSLIHLRRFRDDPSWKEQMPYITEAEAARLLHTSPPIIKRLVQRGFLGTDKRRSGKYSIQFHQVCQADVLALQKKWQDAISVEEVAQVLGASAEVTQDLLEIGLLEAIRGPEMDGTYGRTVSKQSLTTLLDTLEEQVKFYYDNISSDMSLTKTTQMLAAHRYNAARVLKLVAEGELVAYWGWDKERKLSDLRISVRSIEQKLADIREKRLFLTRLDIAKRMGVKVDIVGRWAEMGLLTREQRQGAGWYFDRVEAEQFIADHVFTDEAACIIGFGELAITQWVRNGRLRPVSGPGIDNCHRYLFRRAQVERFRPENRLTAPQLAERLSISRSRIVQWIKQGKVKPISGPGIDGSGQYLFLDSELPK